MAALLIDSLFMNQREIFSGTNKTNLLIKSERCLVTVDLCVDGKFSDTLHSKIQQMDRLDHTLPIPMPCASGPTRWPGGHQWIPGIELISNQPKIIFRNCCMKRLRICPL